MIYQFLLREKKSLEEQLNNCRIKLSDLEIRKKETKRFIQILNENTDRKYAGFTPYDVTKEEDTKIIELKKVLRLLDSDIKILQDSVKELESKIEEYEIMSREAFRLEMQ